MTDEEKFVEAQMRELRFAIEQEKKQAFVYKDFMKLSKDILEKRTEALVKLEAPLLGVDELKLAFNAGVKAVLESEIVRGLVEALEAQAAYRQGHYTVEEVEQALAAWKKETE